MNVFCRPWESHLLFFHKVKLASKVRHLLLQKYYVVVEAQKLLSCLVLHWCLCFVDHKRVIFRLRLCLIVGLH